MARYLIEQEIPIHLVAFEVESEIVRSPYVTFHKVTRPGKSFFFGDFVLSRRGQQVAHVVTRKWPGARVVTNGGNCPWPDVNWVHSVHHAWPCFDEGAPVWFKYKNRLAKEVAKRQERVALQSARLILANSENTRRNLIQHLGVNPGIVQTIYLGSERDIQPPTEENRRAAKKKLEISADRKVVAFVGAMGHDRNKGFDTLWRAWSKLCPRKDWNVDLLVAGAGRSLEKWRQHVSSTRMSHRIHFLNFTNNVDQLLVASDLLVSPVRYEAYGLSVREAVCRGVPALISSAAGVAEHYPDNLREMLLVNSSDVDELTAGLLHWRSNIEYWREQFLPLSKKLRAYTWDDMAQTIVAAVSGDPLFEQEHCANH